MARRSSPPLSGSATIPGASPATPAARAYPSSAGYISVFLELRGGANFSDFVRREFLEASEHLVGDRFRIQCDVSVPANSWTEDRPPPLSDLERHLGNLLAAGEGTDVAFQVAGETFSAHRCVLAARSPVLKELIYGSTRDNEAMSIAVEDVEPDVFKALLHFVYTDSLPPAMDDPDGDKDEQAVWQLLVAAKKYAVERVKLVCVDIVGKRLDGKSVIGNLALADKHHCSEARDACIQFMKRECPDVSIDMWETAARSRKI